MPKNLTQTNRPMKVTAPKSLGEDPFFPESLAGVEALSKPFAFTLQILADVDKVIAFDKVLGQPVTVSISIEKLPDRFFHGVVEEFTQGQRIRGEDGHFSYIRYHAKIVPAFSLLKRRIQSRIFQQKTVVDILKTVMTGIDAKYTDLDSSKFKPRDYCVQYRESDFDFASRLMEEEGIFYYFKHTKAGHQMVLLNTITKYSETETAKFSYEEVHGGIREAERITAWSKRQMVTSGKVTLADYHFEKSTSKLSTTKPILESVAVGKETHKLKVAENDKLEIREQPGRYAQRFDGIDAGGGVQAAELGHISDDGDRTAGIRVQEQSGGALWIQGSSNSRLFSPGFKFTLEKHFNADGAYALTQVTHDVTQMGIRSSADDANQAAFEYGNEFRCIPVALPYAPERTTPKARVEGPHTAIVVGKSGDEIFTDKYGRVKVQFHWEKDGKNNETSSCWVRVATLWAGTNWGMVHIPRVGQEVIVAFEEGDPDQPIIVGSVYNDAHMPPYTLPEKKTQSGIKSRSTLKGGAEDFNELRFEDLKDKEDVYFHAQLDFHRVVERDDDLKVGRHQTRYIENNRTTLIKKGDDTFTIEKGNRIETLKDGDETLTMDKGNRSETLKKGNDTLLMEDGNRETTLKKGNETFTMDKGNRTETLKDGDETVSLKNGERKHTIQKDDTLTINGAHTIKVMKDQKVEITTGNHTLEVKVGNITIKASVGKIEEQALQSIELKCAGSSIKIDPSGVTIKGPVIKIEGQGMAQLKAPMTQVNGDGMLMLKGGVTMIN